MSDAAAERLVVFLEAKVTEFEKRMAKAERTGTGSYTKLRDGSRRATQNMEADMLRTTTRINQALASTSGKIGAFAKSFAAGFAGGVVASAFAGITTGLNETVRGIAAVGDEAKRAGLALKDFQEWKFVAEQNRIGVDALTDGFKELNLRADEFIMTGAGSAAESFNRLGFSSADLAEKLKDPSELMLEIIGRLEGVDKAAQIRIADELFGGTGGERFVELLDQGEAGIRKTIAGAHEAGAVLDDQMIKKAQELDRRWNELATSAGNFFKGVAVGVADAVQSLLGMSTALDAILEDEGRARMVLGNEIYDRLQEGARVTEEQANQLVQVADNTERAVAMAEQLGGVFQAIAATLAESNPELSRDLQNAGQNMEVLAGQLRSGMIEADEFRAKMGELIEDAISATDELAAIDDVGFSTVIAGLQTLARMLGFVEQKARDVTAAMPGGVTKGTPIQGGASANMPPTFDSGMESSPRPGARPDSWTADMDGDGVPDALQTSTGGGRGGGGRGSDRAANSLISSLMTPIEEIQQWHKEAMEALALADEAQLELIGGRHEAIERLETEHQARLRELQVNTNAQRIGDMGDFFGAMAGIAGAGGQRLVKVAATFEAVQGTINAYGAYLKALNSPVPMTPWGRAAAALNILGAGLKGVSAIRSAGGVGGGGGSAVSGSGGGSSSSGGGNEGSGPLRATLEPIDPNAIFTGAALRTLLDNLFEEAGDRGLILGSRS